MATAALPVTGSDAGGYRDAWSDMGGLSGSQWRGLYRALDIAPRFPYSAQERRCLWGGPAMLLMHFSFVSVFRWTAGVAPFPGGVGKVPEEGGKMPRRRNILLETI